MSPKKLLLISPHPVAELGLGGARSPMLEIRSASRLQEGALELSQTRYDAVLLTEAAEDEDLAVFQSELSRMAEPPSVFCSLSEQTATLRAGLLALDISFRGIEDLSRGDLLAALDAAGSPAVKPGPVPVPRAEGWEQILIGESPAIQHIREVIRLIASRSCTVLITGESGTGKEVVARALHLASDRASRPMVSVNCAAVPAALLESEMFGHAKGAFTGAVGNRIGRFEQAHQSTIFLDEIGDTPLELQAKILRVLQEREIQKVGSSAPAKVDVRVLAATNRDLREEMNNGRFRHDLYFRLRVVPLHIPPLRERPEDVPALVDHLLEKICRRERMGAKRIEPGVVSHLAEQPWPGNVRELEHCIEQAIALSGEREVLDLWDFPPFCEVVPLRPYSGFLEDAASERIDLERTIAKLERALIDRALQRSQGNKARAAEMLGLKRSTLVSKVRALQACA
ncbi:MAG: sigma-54 dependent transcriptional regulator [Bryobacterales bacterium]